MKRYIVSILIVINACGPMTARAQQFRHGVVTQMTPIENRGDDETAETKQKRSVGSQLGTLAGNALTLFGPHKAAPVMAAAPTIGAQEGGKLATKLGPPPPTTRFMVKLRLDNGKVLPITQLGSTLQDIQVGSKVRVEGTGSDTQIFTDNAQ